MLPTWIQLGQLIQDFGIGVIGGAVVSYNMKNQKYWGFLIGGLVALVIGLLIQIYIT